MSAVSGLAAKFQVDVNENVAHISGTKEVTHDACQAEDMVSGKLTESDISLEHDDPKVGSSGSAITTSSNLCASDDREISENNSVDGSNENINHQDCKKLDELALAAKKSENDNVIKSEEIITGTSEKCDSVELPTDTSVHVETNIVSSEIGLCNKDICINADEKVLHESKDSEIEVTGRDHDVESSAIPRIDHDDSEKEDSILEQKLNDNITRDCILEPLSFPEVASVYDRAISNDVKFQLDVEIECASDETPCVLCNNLYKNIDEKSQHDEYLCHLVVEHKLVIADVKLIANLRAYSIYWKKRFKEKPIEVFCAVINTNMSPKDVGESEKYYLLCDALVEDRKVREALQLQRLKELIDVQTKERENEEFERMCLFCTKFFIGNRNELFNHMNEDHNFNVGHPHNLIYVEDFLDEIEKKLSSLECLFCDKVFKDRPSLREHMRKKSHRRLNPKNKLYDKYYIINYLELGKNWEVLQSEPDQLEANEDWSGWEEEGQTAVCFFCSSSFNTQDRVFEHMRETHDFDFPGMRKTMNLSFYQQVKMINYIRRTVHQSRQKMKQENDESISVDDIANSVKDCILSSTKWNQPQYYFPTYENDTLLCQLEDKDGLYEPEDNFIIGEDGIDCKAIINESILTDLVVRGYFD